MDKAADVSNTVSLIYSTKPSLLILLFLHIFVFSFFVTKLPFNLLASNVSITALCGEPTPQQHLRLPKVNPSLPLGCIAP